MLNQSESPNKAVHRKPQALLRSAFVFCRGIKSALDSFVIFFDVARPDLNSTFLLRETPNFNG